MANIQLKGVEELSESERNEISSILTASYEKIKRKAKIDFLLKVAFKIYSKVAENKEKRKHYSVQATISGTIRQFDANYEDWDLIKAVRRVVEKLENEIEHVFHSSNQH